MFRKIFDTFFRRSLAETKLSIKDLFLTDKNENITRAIRLIKKFGLEAGETKFIIDVGAFDGSTSILFSKAFPTSPILSFEADSTEFEKAKENCKLFSKIELKNFAISNAAKTLNFHVTANKVSSSLHKLSSNNANLKEYKEELKVTAITSVEAQTLDHFTKDKKIMLLKIDTQGHELKVLEAATETLKNTDFVLLEMSNQEIYEEACKYYEVDSFLRASDFFLIDIIISYRKNGLIVREFDSIYANQKLYSQLTK